MRRSAPSSTIRSDDPAEQAEPTNDHFATVARLQTGATRSERLDVRAEGADRAERWGRGERNSRPEIMDERERRRIDRAEERAVSSRVSESRRRNEAEGFELVRTYRLPDGRRVSVYQRGEPRVAMRQPGLFGRPAFLLPPPGAMWR
jgi:hypothetical protein